MNGVIHPAKAAFLNFFTHNISCLSICLYKNAYLSIAFHSFQSSVNISEWEEEREEEKTWVPFSRLRGRKQEIKPNGKKKGFDFFFGPHMQNVYSKLRDRSVFSSFPAAQLERAWTAPYQARRSKLCKVRIFYLRQTFITQIVFA